MMGINYTSFLKEVFYWYKVLNVIFIFFRTNLQAMDTIWLPSGKI